MNLGRFFKASLLLGMLLADGYAFADRTATQQWVSNTVNRLGGTIATNTVNDLVAEWAKKDQPQPISDVKTNNVSVVVDGVAELNGLASTNYVNEAIGKIVIKPDRIEDASNTIYASGMWLSYTNAAAGVVSTNFLAKHSEITNVSADVEKIMANTNFQFVVDGTSLYIKDHGTNLWQSQYYVPSHLDSTFSNEVLSVGMNVDTNVVATIREMGNWPIDPTTGATTVLGLLTALAAAVAWLKKNKLGAGMSSAGVPTDDNAKVMFEDGNSVLFNTMRYGYTDLSSSSSTSITAEEGKVTRLATLSNDISITLPYNASKVTECIIRFGTGSTAKSVTLLLPSAAGTPEIYYTTDLTGSTLEDATQYVMYCQTVPNSGSFEVFASIQELSA